MIKTEKALIFFDYKATFSCVRQKQDLFIDIVFVFVIVCHCMSLYAV